MRKKQQNLADENQMFTTRKKWWCEHEGKKEQNIFIHIMETKISTQGAANLWDC